MLLHLLYSRLVCYSLQWALDIIMRFAWMQQTFTLRNVKTMAPQCMHLTSKTNEQPTKKNENQTHTKKNLASRWKWKQNIIAKLNPVWQKNIEYVPCTILWKCFVWTSRCEMWCEWHGNCANIYMYILSNGATWKGRDWIHLSWSNVYAHTHS